MAGHGAPMQRPLPQMSLGNRRPGTPRLHGREVGTLGDREHASGRWAGLGEGLGAWWLTGAGAVCMMKLFGDQGTCVSVLSATGLVTLKRSPSATGLSAHSSEHRASCEAARPVRADVRGPSPGTGASRGQKRGQPRPHQPRETADVQPSPTNACHEAWLTAWCLGTALVCTCCPSLASLRDFSLSVFSVVWAKRPQHGGRSASHDSPASLL